MTALTIDYAGSARIVDLCRLYLRAPESCSMAGGVVTFNFVPALTAPEQTTFDRIANLSKSLIPGITADEWTTLVEPARAVSQTFRARTRAQFLALTAAQQAGALYDLAVAHDDVLRAILKN